MNTLEILQGIKNWVVGKFFTKADAESKADIDGYYDLLHAGEAKNIEGTTPVEAVFTGRTAGGTADIATGLSSVEGINGNTVVWNQMINKASIPSTEVRGDVTYTNNNDGSITLDGTSNGSPNYIINSFKVTKNHKYCFRIIGTTGTSGYIYYIPYQCFAYTESYISIIRTATATGTCDLILRVLVNKTVDNVKITPQVHDLTLMFGTGNEPSTVEQFENWLASNVGLKDYYPYNAGELINAKPLGLQTVGFNLFDSTTGKAQLPVATSGNLTNGTDCYQITGTYTSIADADGNTITPNANGYFNVGKAGEITVTGGNSTTCVHLTWSGQRNGEYKPYWNETKPFDVTKIYGKLNGEGELVQVFPNGMKKADYAGTVRDSLYVENGETKAVVRVGNVDLGTLIWNTVEIGNVYQHTATIGDKRYGITNLICERYEVNAKALTREKEDTICGADINPNLYVTDSSYTDNTSFKSAMSGVMLNYELATLLTYTDLVYIDNNEETPFSLPINYKVNDFGTEKQVFPTSLSDELTSCAAELSLRYGVNAADFIKNAPKNFVSIDSTSGSTGSFDYFLAQLGAAMGGTWTKAWSSESNRWEFSFQQSEQPTES